MATERLEGLQYGKVGRGKEDRHNQARAVERVVKTKPEFSPNFWPQSAIYRTSKGACAAP